MHTLFDEHSPLSLPVPSPSVPETASTSTIDPSSSSLLSDSDSVSRLTPSPTQAAAHMDSHRHRYLRKEWRQLRKTGSYPIGQPGVWYPVSHIVLAHLLRVCELHWGNSMFISFRYFISRFGNARISDKPFTCLLDVCLTLAAYVKRNVSLARRCYHYSSGVRG